jgi:hypothetical protein
VSVATLARETALADIRRRGRTPHIYGHTGPVIALRKAHPGTMRKAAAAVAAELTHKDKTAGRELSTISAKTGLADVLLLISQGFRQIGVVEVAAVCDVAIRTAQTAMATLRELGILGGPRGVKGLSMTSWQLMPRGVEMLTAAFERVRDALRRRKFKHASFAHRVTPPPKGRALPKPATPPNRGPERPKGTPPPIAEVLALASGATGQECEHGSTPGRCGICRRQRC